jgi:hypothetical protein
MWTHNFWTLTMKLYFTTTATYETTVCAEIKTFLYYKEALVPVLFNSALITQQIPNYPG